MEGNEIVDRLKGMASSLKRRPVDVVGIDVASSETKMARLKKSGDSVELVGADVIPSVTLPEIPDEEPIPVEPVSLPKELVAKHAAFALTSVNSIIKVLSFPSHGGAAAQEVESRVVDSLGVEDPDLYRIGYKLLSEGHGRSESRALVVAIPDVEAGAACALLPLGLPAPHSVEVSGLAAMTTFLNGPGTDAGDDTVGMVEFGGRTSFFAIFRKKVPVMVRKFEFGSDTILEKVQKSLGIDRSTAEGIVSDGSFDISQQISEVMDGFIKQVIVSRDFVERRENCQVSRIFASGGITVSRDWTLEMRSGLGLEIEVWNPFDCLNAEGIELPASVQGKEGRFAAAIGAALGTLLEDEA